MHLKLDNYGGIIIPPALPPSGTMFQDKVTDIRHVGEGEIGNATIWVLVLINCTVYIKGAVKTTQVEHQDRRVRSCDKA